MLIALAGFLALAPQIPLILSLDEVLSDASRSYGDFEKRAAESSDEKLVYDLTVDDPNADTPDVMRVTFHVDDFNLVRTYETQYKGRAKDLSHTFGSFLDFFERVCHGRPGSIEETLFVTTAGQRAIETGQPEAKVFGSYRLEVEGGYVGAEEAASDITLTLRLTSVDPRVPSRCVVPS